MNLKKEFSSNESKKLIEIFQKWHSDNLIIERGKSYNNVENTFGLPYTSSGMFAGLWNTNTQSIYTKDNSMQFDGIGYTENLTPVAFFTKFDKDGNEIEDVVIYMVEN